MSIREFESNLNPESPPFEPSRCVINENQFESSVDSLEDSSNDEIIKEKENSPSAVVPPNKFEKNSFPGEKFELTDRESEVPRNESQTNELEIATDPEKDEEISSLSDTEFIAGEGPRLEDGFFSNRSVRRSIDLSAGETADGWSAEQWDDILGNKSILKKIVEPGENESRPSRNSLATISYELFLVDRTNNDIRFIERVSHLQFFVNQFDVFPAIDISVQLMDRGERSIIDADPRHCYGQLGCSEKNIPPIEGENFDYRMKIDLVLEEWKIPEEISDLSVEQRIFWGERKKSVGNIAYRRGEYSTALHCYQQALNFLDTNTNPIRENQSEEKVLIDRFVQVENNRAQTFLVSEQFDKCLQSADNVLRIESDNVKALFRRCRALLELGRFEESKEQLKKLVDIQSDDLDKPKIVEMIRFCDEKLKRYEHDEKEICRRMFRSSNKEEDRARGEQSSSPEDQKNKKKKSALPVLAIGLTAVAAVGIALFIKWR